MVSTPSGLPSTLLWGGQWWKPCTHNHPNKENNRQKMFIWRKLLMVIKNNNLVFNAKVSLTCLFAFNYLSAQNPRPWCSWSEKVSKNKFPRGAFPWKRISWKGTYPNLQGDACKGNGECRSDWKPIGKQTSALNCKLKEKSRKGTIMEISSRLNCHTTMMLTSTLQCFVRTLIERKWLFSSWLSSKNVETS